MEEFELTVKKEFSGDFLTGELLEFKIGEREFKIRELKAEEYDDILSRSFKIENGKFSLDYSVRNKEWVKLCLVSAPYSLEGKAWKELTPEERLELFQKLKAPIRLKVIEQIRMLNEPEGDFQKN